METRTSQRLHALSTTVAQKQYTDQTRKHTQNSRAKRGATENRKATKHEESLGKNPRETPCNEPHVVEKVVALLGIVPRIKLHDECVPDAGVPKPRAPPADGSCGVRVQLHDEGKAVATVHRARLHDKAHMGWPRHTVWYTRAPRRWQQAHEGSEPKTLWCSVRNCLSRTSVHDLDWSVTCSRSTEYVPNPSAHSCSQRQMKYNR